MWCLNLSLFCAVSCVCVWLQAAERDYPITTYQPHYYVAKSFEDAKLQMSRFAASLSRAFNVSYNARAQTLVFDRDLRMRPLEPPKKPGPGRSAEQH